MKPMPLIANIELGTTGVVIFVNAHVLGTVKWITVNRDGDIIGFNTEPWLNRLGNWRVDSGSSVYLGSVTFEEDDNYKEMKWEVQFTNASASTELSE